MIALRPGGQVMAARKYHSIGGSAYFIEDPRFGALTRPTYTILLKQGDEVRRLTVGKNILFFAISTLIVLAVLCVPIKMIFITNEYYKNIEIYNLYEKNQQQDRRLVELQSRLDEAVNANARAAETIAMLETVAKRQQELEERTNTLQAFIHVGGTRRVLGGALGTDGTTTTRRPIGTLGGLGAQVFATLSYDQDNRTEQGYRTSIQGSTNSLKTAMLYDINTSIDNIVIKQDSQIREIVKNITSRSREMRAAYADIGINLQERGRRDSLSVGGPFVPLDAQGRSVFNHQAAAAARMMSELQNLSGLFTKLPVGWPHDGNLPVTSSFGPRRDPFLGRWAMHSGVDFRGRVGANVRASGAGRVVHAGPMGAYGLTIDIAHEAGFVSRYAHLSRIEVAVGQNVGARDIIGHVGSTGRSTGPHLHYEVRRWDDAVDPMRFIRAGQRIRTAAIMN